MTLGNEIREGFAIDLEREMARKIIRATEKWRKGGKIKTAQERWLFELMQNAIDITKERENKDLKIEIIIKPNRITFKHNGGYFTPIEIRALIFAYSTKPYDRESELAGKFATGFLVTHIVSERVEVKGILSKDEEYYEFRTILDRTSDNINKICDSFQNSFNELDLSKNKGMVSECWTEYTYKVTDNVGKEAINIGISEFKKHLPFLLTFNKISCVTINGERYMKEEQPSEDILIEKVSSNQVYVKEGKNAEVAILESLKDTKIISLSTRPKIYVKGLPLIETGYVNIPFIIHSTKFETTEDRDTLTDTDENKEILVEAFTLYYELLDHVSKYPNKKMGELHNLLDFKTIPEEKIMQNPLWNHINQIMRETVKKIAEDISIVETFEGRKGITNVIFPREAVKSTKLKDEIFEQFYSLLIKIKKNVPIQNELHSWISLASNLQKEFRDIIDIKLYGIEDMKKDLEEFVRKGTKLPHLEDFNKEYGLSDSKQFLLSFFGLVNELYKQGIIEPAKFIDYLLTDQTGIVGSLNWGDAQLYIDESIPEDFKDIVFKIGWQIRQELLDRDFAGFEITRDLLRDTKDVEKALEILIDKYQLEEEINDEEKWDDKVTGWIELFRLCVANRKLCKGFLIITKDGKVQQIEDLNNEAFLVPFKLMGINEEFEDIFPENRILHNKYFEVENIEEFIRAPEYYKAFITNLPVYKTNMILGYNKLQFVLEEKVEISKVEHKMVSETDAFSALPFWNEVIGRISAYQERARLLFKFIIGYLINKDGSWERYLEVGCSCKDKNHKIIPSQWLASLKSDAWVPFKDEEEKIVPRQASKESIENLFSLDELDQLIITNPEKITKLLPHFGFDELDLKIKLQSIEIKKPEEIVRKEVCKLVDITNIVPDLPDIVHRDIYAFKEAIEKLKDELQKEPIREENKKIGENVEKIVREILSKAGFKIRPIYKGGDLEIWPGNEGWNSGEIEIEPYLLEIKFTSGGRAHLSRVQSEMARNKKEDYIVLVVENAGSLRDKLKMDIEGKAIPKELITMIRENSHIIQKIYSKLGDVPNPDEVEPDIHGYWLKRKLWDDTDNILKWTKKVFAVGV